MKKYLFLALLGACFWIYAGDVDENRNKFIEKKWGLGEDDDIRPVRIQPATNVSPNMENVFPMFLEPHKPSPQTFQINPNMENKITGKYGTEITIPGNAIGVPSQFRNGDVITIELIEILNDLDFVTFGVDMLYYDSKSKPNLFESAGMFKIKAIYYNRELNLKKGAKMKVQIPQISSSRSMRIYTLDESKGWIDRGTEERGEQQSSPINEERITFRFFGLLDKFGTWNFDYPNPETTCVSGKIQILEANPPYTVTVIGQDYAGAYTKSYKTPDFKINTIRSKKMKLLAADSRGNLGIIDFDSPSKENFITPANYESAKCDPIGTIELKKVGPAIRNDRNKLLDFLGLYDRFR